MSDHGFIEECEVVELSAGIILVTKLDGSPVECDLEKIGPGAYAAQSIREVQ